MKALIFLLLLPLCVRAHVGSPDVFFEGQAGPHVVRVVIRPPAVLPGLAQVDVRAADAVTGVWLRAAYADAGSAAAPAPVAAEPVADDPHLFHTALWLLRDGAYSVTVALESGGGRMDTVILPLTSAALRPPVMAAGLQVVLVVLGLLLFCGAIVLGGAAARDSGLAPGAAPTRHDRTRGHRVAGLMALLLSSAIGAGALRWQGMDRAFREDRIGRPLPVVASVRSDGDLRLLHLTPAPGRGANAGWNNLVTDHGKLAHCFLINEADAAAFAHLHPVRCDARTFESVLPAVPAGAYRLYAELTHANGRSDTLTGRVELPEPLAPAVQPAWNPADDVWCLTPRVLADTAPAPTALDPDDSWQVREGAPEPHVSPLSDGRRMVLQNAAEFVENQPVTLRFAVFDGSGSAVPLQPYMGMPGHAVVQRSDGEVFTHLHPAGTISMAAQELLEQKARPADAPPATPAPRLPGGEVTFPYAFPRAGDYRIWVQVRIEGRIATGVFDVKVQAAGDEATHGGAR